MTAKLLSSVALGVALALPAFAFTLDARFTDADGDMIADIPTDAAQLVDPSVLIFAYTPVEDPAVYAEAWADFLTHMEAVTGKPVEFFPVQSNAAQIEAMRAGRFISQASTQDQTRWPWPVLASAPSR